MSTKNNNKTIVSNISVEKFLTNYPNFKIVPDCLKLVKLFEIVTGDKAKIWGNMVGFGSYDYKYESGREGDYFVTGFAPSKVGITIYTNCDLSINLELLKRLGKFQNSKSCLYIKKLEDIDEEVLKEVIRNSCEYIKAKYQIGNTF